MKIKKKKKKMYEEESDLVTGIDSPQFSLP